MRHCVHSAAAIVQSSRTPITVASTAAPTTDQRSSSPGRAAAYGDGWYALTGTKYGDEFEFIPKFQHMLSDAGREPASCPITICLYPEELDMHAPDQVGALKRYQDLGVTRCIVGLKTDKAPANLPTLDRWANFMRRMRSA
jgi:hypothetical protein